MKEYIEEYGGIIVVVLAGLSVLSGFWEIITMICNVAA